MKEEQILSIEIPKEYTLNKTELFIMLLLSFILGLFSFIVIAYLNGFSLCTGL